MKNTKLFLILLLLTVLSNVRSTAQNIEADISNISLPLIEWSLHVEFDDFEVQKNNFAPDGTSRQIMAVIKDKGFTASVFIEKAATDGDHLACREYYWEKAKQSPLAKENLNEYEIDNIAIIEHDTKEYNGQEVNYHSLNAYLSYGDYWIDIHISKIGYEKKDKDVFDKIVNSAKIDNPKKRNVSELFLFGSQAYYMRNYEIAINAYEGILETEKQKILIDKSLWYVVVDNLGMAYGISGDFENSKRILKYGLELDPKYPNFYYNLACTYAETSDIENALINLDLAYSNKKHLIKGERLTNPRHDSSFNKYSQNKEFKEFLKKYNL